MKQKPKTLLLSFLACICAISCILGFAACKDPKKPVVYKDDYITAKGYTEYVNLGDGWKDYEYILETDRVVPEVTDEHSWAEYDISTGISANAGYSISAWYIDEGKTETVIPENGTVLYGTNDYFIDVVDGEGNIVRSYVILINGVCKSSDHVWSEWSMGGKCFGKAAEYRTCSTCQKTEKKNVVDRAWHNYVNGVCDLCGKEVTPTEAFYFETMEGGVRLVIAYEDLLPQDVIIPDYYQGQKVISLEGGAFQDIDNVKSVFIPDTVTSISGSFFSDCDSLTTVNLPDSLTNLENGCFAGCPSLDNVVIPYGITEIGESMFGGCTSLMNITIPNSVTKIENGAFWGCVSLSSVELPQNLIAIGDRAFYDCNNLKSLSIPEGVTTIGEMAFPGNMTSVSIPNSVVSLGDIPGGENLNYTEYDTAKYLGNSSNPYLVLATAELYGKSSFTIHEDTKFLYGYLGAPTDVKKLTIPKNVIYISWRSLDQFQGLTEFIVDEENTAYKAIEGNLYTIDGKTLVSYASGKTETEFVVPESVTTIGDYAFRYNSELTSITIPTSITSIKSDAFYCNSNLTSITYLGTKASWEAIEKEYQWNYNGRGSDADGYFKGTITTVVCTDGTITLEPYRD